MVRLQPELALERRHHRALYTRLAWERRPAQLRLDEELAVEDRGRGVERRARDRRVDIVLRGDGVRDEEPDDLERVEASGVEEAGENVVDEVCRMACVLVLEHMRRA